MPTDTEQYKTQGCLISKIQRVTHDIVQDKSALKKEDSDKYSSQGVKLQNSGANTKTERHNMLVITYFISVK